MIVFRCSRCSKVTISSDAHHCLHCGKEVQVSATSENQTGGRIPSSTSKNFLLYVQNKSKGSDLTVLPEASEKLSVTKLNERDEKDKDIETLNVNRSPICSSQEKPVSAIAQNSVLKQMLISTNRSTCSNTFHSAGNGRHYLSTKYDASAPTNTLLHVSKQSSRHKSKNNLHEKKTLKHNKRTKSLKNKTIVGKMNLASSRHFSPEKPMLNSFKENKVKETKGDQDKTNSSNLSSKRNNPAISKRSLDDLKVANEFPHHSSCSREVSRDGSSKNDFSDKVLIKRIKVPTLQNFYLCNKCGKTFTNESKSTRHFLRHFEEKRFKCDKCDKKYSSEAHLKRHYNTHMDKGLFKCDLCNMVYARSCHLSRHRKKHILELAVDGSTSEKKVDQSSQQKEQETSGDSSSEEHLETSAEKIFVCTHCGVKFIHESDFNAHCLRHSKEKPFKCNKCNIEFRYEVDLNRHYGIHSLERPFICHICDFTATQKSNLQKHLRIHS